MEIAEEMLSELFWKQLSTARYMELPEPERQGRTKYILQHHWRGRSVHWDFRFEVNDHLNGWSILDNPKVEKGPTSKEEAERLARTLNWSFKPKPGMDNRKCRAETKAKQPKDWLRVEGEVKPGTVGATRHGPGFFYIADEGNIWFGAQKPWYHEYFLDGRLFKKIRVNVRAVPMRAIDPETKRPIPGKVTLVWNIWVPEDQNPYAVSKRAEEEGWYPPKGFIPIPDWWREEHPKEFQEWLERAKAHWEGRSEVKKSPATFSLVEHRWMRLGRTGEPIGTRKLPKMEWYLRFEQGGRVRGFLLESNPLWYEPLAAIDEGFIDRKWLTWEGELNPREAYNTNKELKSRMTVLDRGEVKVSIGRADGRELILLNFKGKSLKGAWEIEQEESKAEVYQMRRSALRKSEHEFVLHEHRLDDSVHFDVRIDRGTYLDEWAMDEDPRELGFDEPVRALRKKCLDRSWLTAEGERKVGSLTTRVKILDKGTVTLVEDSPWFSSFVFRGRELRGWYVLKRTNSTWQFIRSRLPEPEERKAEREPGTKPKPNKPPEIQSKEDAWVVHLYPIEEFTSCAPEERVGLYDAPKPPKDGILRICFYPRPGTIHGALIQAIELPKSSYRTREEVEAIDFEPYQKWEGVQLRGSIK